MGGPGTLNRETGLSGVQVIAPATHDTASAVLSVPAFSRVLPVFAASRRVIAVEEQGHGRSTDRDQPVAFESSADDVAALLRHLKVTAADILGFSNGASVALQAAVRHPALVRKLVFASSMTRR